MSKNICFFCGDVTRNAGSERAAVMAASMCRENGWHVQILSLTERNPEKLMLSDGISHEALFDRPIRMRYDFAAVTYRLTRWLRKNQPDVLVGVDVIQTLNALPARVFSGLRKRCRYFAWEHFHYENDMGCRARRFARKIAMRFADAVIVLTERDRQQYLEHGPKVPVICIPNAVPEPPEASSVSSGLVPDGPFVLSVGRFSPEKGFDQIPAMAESFFAEHPGWKWVVAGDGPERAKIEQDAAARGLSGKMIFPGTCDPYPFYRKASIFALTSHVEGFVLVLLEALSQGVPAVAFDCKCSPTEMIAGGQNGFLIPCGDTAAFADRLAYLADHEDERKTMASFAPRSVERFRKENIAPLWCGLLNGDRK